MNWEAPGLYEITWILAKGVAWYVPGDETSWSYFLLSSFLTNAATSPDLQAIARSGVVFRGSMAL
jgi:hypothetical protein